MCVCRVNKTKNYTVMSNYHLQDKRLSIKAKGLLSFMLSLPDDWDYTVRGLAYFSNDGIWCITNTLNELKRFGYLVVTKLTPDKTKSGRIEYVYDIFEESQIKDNYVEKKSRMEKRKSRKLSSAAIYTRRGFSTLEKTNLENRAQQNTNIQNTKDTKKEKNEDTEVSEKKEKEKDKGQKNFSRAINPEERKEKDEEQKKFFNTNYITESEEKSIGSGVIMKKNLLVEKEKVEEPTKEPIKEEHIPIEKRKEKTEEHKTFKKIVNKKTEELEPTEEETKQSKAIINELNNCIKQYTNENNAQDINMTPKFLNAIVYWLRKGFQLSDFFKIIKLKVRTWIGTDLATQIKPSVLFSQHNFQEYLEETKLEKFTNPIYKRKPEQNPQPTRTNCQTEGNKEDDDKIMRLAIEKHKKEIAERVKDAKPTPEQIEWCKNNFGGLLSRIGYSV